MNVFISFSGARSKKVAEYLYEWLPLVLHPVTPFFSGETIRSGERGEEVIQGNLSKADFGIVCLTRDNRLAPWINYEAGAIALQLNSKSDGTSYSPVSALLIDLSVDDVEPPLSQFQHRQPDYDQLLKLVQDVNHFAGDESIPADRLSKLYKKFWPDFKTSFDTIREETESSTDDEAKMRSDRELIEEILSLSRKQTKITESIARSHPDIEDLLNLVTAGTFDNAVAKPNEILQARRTLRKLRDRIEEAIVKEGDFKPGDDLPF
jgi:hypothetical protein